MLLVGEKRLKVAQPVQSHGFRVSEDRQVVHGITKVDSLDIELSHLGAFFYLNLSAKAVLPTPPPNALQVYRPSGPQPAEFAYHSCLGIFNNERQGREEEGNLANRIRTEPYLLHLFPDTSLYLEFLPKS